MFFAKLVICFTLLLIILFFFLSYLKNKQLYKIILSSIFTFFLLYSFFSYNGALKLTTLILSRDVQGSYTTNFINVIRNDNTTAKYFLSTKPIYMYEGTGEMGIIACESYFLIKVCYYFGGG